MRFSNRLRFLRNLEKAEIISQNMIRKPTALDQLYTWSFMPGYKEFKTVESVDWYLHGGGF